MYNMFEEVKQYLTPVQVVKFYLGEGNLKAGSYWYVSPFRNEKTASFCANDRKGIHDFGDNTHYDVISFTAKMFNISNKEAISKLINDFRLPIDFKTRKPRIFYERDLALFKLEQEKKDKERKQIKEFYDQMYECASSKFKKCGDLISDLQTNRQALKNANLAQIYSNRDHLEWIVDALLESTPEEVWQNREFWEGRVLWS